MFKLVSLGFSLFVFILTTTWTTPEIFNLLISVLFSLYCIWCIWSLHEALMLGGEAAAKAGFTAEEVLAFTAFTNITTDKPDVIFLGQAGENSPLFNSESKQEKTESHYV
jgi:hypothetical protein